jgi:ABC-type Fe3+/spermidine/putrescine transport system ATPase subunit
VAEDRTVAIALEGVSKRYGKAEAVRGVSLAIGEGEFFSLLGPSGCGKTTLRMIAGFEVPDEGRILLQGRDVTSVLPSRRPVNMVFQQYALFPHFSRSFRLSSRSIRSLSSPIATSPPRPPRCVRPED